MSDQLPQFRYHPDPIASGVISLNNATCICCGYARGYVYGGPLYTAQDVEGSVCPWCIANGEAAARLNASFVADYPLLQSGLPSDIVEEVCSRTPGYYSWQQEEWLSHCGDACEFHGDASVEDIRSASITTKAHWMANYQLSEDDWVSATKDYQPGGHSAFYKFVCRHCGQVSFGWDLP
ncbi:CbrC family protein [Leeia aquatica]|uniref:CbrC family protein n=1 Tax=Leeia aquatica TaxID=2725557 RepID=A0A847RT64_9NEIS|nr:hypothetical protein [Leeia aquatica]